MKPSMWKIKRKEPYTSKGIARLKCIRCDKPASFQWQICSDGNNYRPICGPCDIELNEVVLKFFKHPETDELISRYIKSMYVRK